MSYLAKFLNRVWSVLGGADHVDSDIFRRVYAGGGWVLGCKLATLPLGLVATGLLARLLTPDELGVYFLALSLAGLTASLSRMGLAETSVYQIAEAMGTGRPGRARDVVHIATRLTAVGSFALGTALALGAGKWLALHIFASTALADLSTVIGFWVVVLAFQMLFGEIFRGLGDIRLASIFSGFVPSAGSALLFAGLYVAGSQVDLVEVIVLSLFVAGTNATLAGFLLRRKAATLGGAGKSRTGETLSISLPLLIAFVGTIPFTYGGVWLTGVFHDEEAVAIYSVAARLVALSAAPLVVVNSVISPLIAELHGQGERAKLQRMLRASAALAGLPALGILAVCVFAPETVLSVVYGPSYREGAMILMILCLGQLANVLSGPCAITLTMAGQQKMFMAISMVCALLVIALGLTLVKPYGVAGVAVAISSATALYNLAMWVGARFAVGVWTHIPVEFVQVPRLNRHR